ncbi:XRE family transcriptional regulator [Defluviimonas sp. WL0002]|uniref:XRE family transcriptional regulator n=1 Tax=Albidovulum marisflavi TaxID=2984159 RepID=A0ABT2ZF28_9RHOB|nr:XRE family transcriptional regulator [Defluviimonas sp. WL0002]MCV2869743.1 XRE family transcriptional regulator [Defluviimonas sp. WL0002]
MSEKIDHYRIGAKIRAMRTAKGLGLIQLGAHTGLSAGMLSKIETGQVVPTLPTLMRIALVFGVGLEHFFTPPVDPILEIVRKEDRLSLPNPPEGPPAYHFESLDFPVAERPIESYLAEFRPGAPASPTHLHAGVELIFVISGTLALFIHDSEKLLGAGDSMYFESDYDHSYACIGQEPTRVLVVVSSAQV